MFVILLLVLLYYISKYLSENLKLNWFDQSFTILVFMKSTKKLLLQEPARELDMNWLNYFQKQGTKVLALSRNSKPISELNDPNVTSLSFNLNNSSDFNIVNDFIKKEWNNNVDILINNAGSLINKPFIETTAEDFKIFLVQMFLVFELIKCVIPFMSFEGHVVTISSMGGVQGSMKFAGLSAIVQVKELLSLLQNY